VAVSPRDGFGRRRSRFDVADLLGHSSIAIAGDVYCHTSDDTTRTAVDGLAGRVGL
jgi:hypothetical protein